MCKTVRLLSTVGLGLFLMIISGPLFAQNLASTEIATKRPLTLKDTLQRLQSSPTMKAASKNIAIKQGQAKQAGLLPNPDVAIELENFGGNDDLTGMGGAEITVALSQLIEFGGKRAARKSVADHKLGLAQWEYQSQEQDLQTATMKAFYALLSAQERLDQAKQLLNLSEQGYQTVADRVEAGKVSPIQKLRAGVELNMARLGFESAKVQRTKARLKLSSMWGASAPDFDVVVGAFDELSEPPEWDTLQTHLFNNSDVLRWKSELASKNANLDLERAGMIPDATLIFGVRKFNETDNNALVAGLEFPLPVFDRNQGRRMAALAEVSQLTYQRDAAIAELTSELQSAYQELLASYHQAHSIQQEIMPTAEQANAATQIGYREGKFDFLDVLDAQRTLFEVKGKC
jgi:cobalt-zinc-cadmium efflux system outer membrane protein